MKYLIILLLGAVFSLYSSDPHSGAAAKSNANAGTLTSDQQKKQDRLIDHFDAYLDASDWKDSNHGNPKILQKLSKYCKNRTLIETPYAHLGGLYNISFTDYVQHKIAHYNKKLAEYTAQGKAIPEFETEIVARLHKVRDLLLSNAELKE